MSVRIVTYNILVPKLAEEPGHFYACQPKYLDIRYRWPLIQRQLMQEIQHHQKTIICLQEVSRSLLSTLQSFFRQMNYTFFESLYGNEHNDHMGVAIAIPASMKIIFKRFIPIGDHLRSTIESVDRRSAMLSSLWLQNVKGATLARVDKVGKDIWELAMERRNQLIVLQVLIDGQPLSIGTYHMPCLFDKPEVMTIHALAIKDLMFRLSGRHPFILAGDFNSRPKERPYRVLTDRTVAQQITLPNIPNTNVPFPFDRRTLLHSAYRTRNGTEPAFTNFSTTKNAPHFTATLDYIFFAGSLMPTDVLPLPSRPTSESYPDREHPSDHLMLAASFRLH